MSGLTKNESNMPNPLSLDIAETKRNVEQLAVILDRCLSTLYMQAREIEQLIHLDILGELPDSYAEEFERRARPIYALSHELEVLVPQFQSNLDLIERKYSELQETLAGTKTFAERESSVWRNKASELDAQISELKTMLAAEAQVKRTLEGEKTGIIQAAQRKIAEKHAEIVRLSALLKDGGNIADEIKRFEQFKLDAEAKDRERQTTLFKQHTQIQAQAATIARLEREKEALVREKADLKRRLGEPHIEPLFVFSRTTVSHETTAVGVAAAASPAADTDADAAAASAPSPKKTRLG